MTVADDYTPTTDEVREFWASRQTYEHDWTIDTARSIFDRWFAGMIAAKRAEWKAESGEEEFLVLDGSGDFWAMTSTLLEADHYALQKPGATIQQRHCTPWLPVTNTESEGKA